MGILGWIFLIVIFLVAISPPLIDRIIDRIDDDKEDF